jgi:hypothetical protein
LHSSNKKAYHITAILKVDKLQGFIDRERQGKEEDIIQNLTIKKNFKAHIINDQIFKHTYIEKITIIEKK